MRVFARNARLLVSEQRRNREFAEAVVGGDRRIAVPQHVRREIATKPARLATRSQTLWKPRISLSAPIEAGNTSSPNRGSARSTSQAACDRGRSDEPVFVSASRAVRVAKSISDHLSARASPRRQPVTARNLWPPPQPAMSFGAWSAVPSEGTYSSFVARRWRSL